MLEVKCKFWHRGLYNLLYFSVRKLHWHVLFCFILNIDHLYCLLPKFTKQLKNMTMMTCTHNTYIHTYIHTYINTHSRTHARMHKHTYYVRTYLTDKQTAKTDRQTDRQVDKTIHKRVERGYRAVILLRQGI